MAYPVPSQLFDGSYYEAITAAPDDKGAQSPPTEVLEDWETSEEVRDFSWDSYNSKVLKRLPKPLQERVAASPQLREIMAMQQWIAKRLPAPITAFLTHDLPVKTLWEHLSSDELRPLKHEALRGFQQTPGSLRREPVQKRIVAWLERHPEEIPFLLLRWGLREPAPPALEAIMAQPDEATLKGRLPSLTRSFGVDATFVALAYAAKPRVFKSLWTLIQDIEAFKVLMENAPELTEDAPPQTQNAPEPDSQSAKYWHDQVAQNSEKLARLDAALSQIEAMNARLATSDARIATLESEAQGAKRREKQNVLQATKRLAGAEKKWAEKYDELERTHARSERRLRALLTQVEELEAENKKQKKQIRQGAQSREDERKKVVSLEAKINELAPDETPTAEQNGGSPNGRAPMNAVSTPATTQDAPNLPVKVARPGPLDEIFEWMADGRRVRLTAREVRRLIDKNDEDRVADIMLALEALQGSNPDLRRQFLARLKEAGPHYPRVLTGKTTRVLVDASNVARFCPNKYGKGRLSHLLSMRAELQRLNCWPIEFIADASLPYYIDQPQELREMARAGEILITDKGIEADEVLAREARKTGAYVVTNDARFFYKVSPDYEPPRISFRVHDDLVIVDEF